MPPKEYDQIDGRGHDFYMMLCARIGTGSTYRTILVNILQNKLQILQERKVPMLHTHKHSHHTHKHTHTHTHTYTHTHTHTYTHTHTHTHTHTEIPMLLTRRISGSGEDDCQVCCDTYDQMQKPMELTGL